MHTIFAQCSGYGKSGVSVIRISGKFSIDALSILTRNNVGNIQPRKVYLRKIYKYDGANEAISIADNNQLIDDAIIIYFKAPNSFTGEEVVEIHTHGSIIITKLLYESLSKIDGVRLAEPGEFTKRAFLNNKMKLTSAEGLADLIDAETEMQHIQALNQMHGALDRLYSDWRKDLLYMSTLLEAYIDFPDEDIDDPVTDELFKIKDQMIDSMEYHLNDNRKGEILRNGIKLAIIGSTNVGKSSLINFLSDRNLSIVSDISGTTRDVIEGHINIGGYPIIIQDTAGIHDKSDNDIETIGIEKAKQTALDANIKILLLGIEEKVLKQNSKVEAVEIFYRKIEEDFNKFKDFIDENTVIIVNKMDLIDKNQASFELKVEKIIKQFKSVNIIFISIKESCNIRKVVDAIKNLAQNIAKPDIQPQITRERHRLCITNALNILRTFSFNDDIVISAENVRLAMRELDNVIGTISVEEILGSIFSNFCIGK